MHITYSDMVQMAKIMSFVMSITEEWVPQSPPYVGKDAVICSTVAINKSFLLRLLLCIAD